VKLRIELLGYEIGNALKSLNDTNKTLSLEDFDAAYIEYGVDEPT
jgi:hypothetical protein